MLEHASILRQAPNTSRPHSAKPFTPETALYFGTKNKHNKDKRPLLEEASETDTFEALNPQEASSHNTTASPSQSQTIDSLPGESDTVLLERPPATDYLAWEAERQRQKLERRGRQFNQLGRLSDGIENRAKSWSRWVSGNARNTANNLYLGISQRASSACLGATQTTATALRRAADALEQQTSRRPPSPAESSP